MIARDANKATMHASLQVSTNTVHVREVYSQTLIVVNRLASDAQSANWMTLIKVPRRTPIHLACVYCTVLASQLAWRLR
jgi:hypothetical protein